MLEEKEKTLYPKDSVGRLMSTNVPVCSPTETLENIQKLVFTNTWDSAHSIFVIDSSHKLLGTINLARHAWSSRNPKAKDIMAPAHHVLAPQDDQEKAVIFAIRDDVITIPVVNEDEVLQGVVTAGSIIDVMHSEHIEDSLLAAGIHRRGRTLHRISDGVGLSVITRAPWLIVGTLAGLFLSLLTSQFEEALQTSIAIAYFIPVVAYVAGSIGAQSSAIAVRTLAFMKIEYIPYLSRELFTGACLGGVVGLIGLAGAFFISQSAIVAAAVSISLFFTSIISTVLAAVIPFLLAFFKKDPAMGSGPLATASLDIISITLYFFITTSIL